MSGERGKRDYNMGEYENAEREFRKILEFSKWMPRASSWSARRVPFLHRTPSAVQMIRSVGRAFGERGFQRRANAAAGTTGTVRTPASCLRLLRCAVGKQRAPHRQRIRSQV